MTPFLTETFRYKFVGIEIYCFLALFLLILCRKWLFLSISFVLVMSKKMLSISVPEEWNHPFYAVINRPRMGILVVGLAAFLSSAAVSCFVHWPVASAHDEFSYLLAADTFSRGRLANPAHPQWESFESMHIIQQPTYASKYPPAQGLALAAGQLLAGRPIVGVWLSFALMCAALCWMLQAWLSPPWALLGAALATLRIGFVGQAYDTGIFGYWSQSYWGGAVAATGGALLFGALRRLWDRPAISLSLIFALGLAVLANSRPYEGFLTAIPVAGSLVFWYFKNNEISRKIKVQRVIIPISAAMIFVGSWIGYYNWRVTGDPLTMPYQVHERTYAAAPYFHWLGVPPEPVYRHKAIRDFQVGWWKQYYLDQQSFAKFMRAGARKIGEMWIFYLGALLTVPMLLSFQAIRKDAWVRWAFFVCCFVIAGMFPITHMPLPHYSAPIMCLIVLMVASGMRSLYSIRWIGGRFGKMATFVILSASFCSILFPLTHGMYSKIPNWTFPEDRHLVFNQLKKSDGFNLVVVRYEEDHNPNAEWVYNEADIDKAKTVWAREGEDHGRLMKLFSYFPNRIRWVLEADKKPPQLRHYSELPPSMLKPPPAPNDSSKN